MYISEFDYDLPEELIAHYPLPQRSASRLLCVNKKTGEYSHHPFSDLLDFLTPQDLLIFNDTKVIPARLFASKETGGKVEILLERILDSQRILAHMRANKSIKIGTKILIEGKIPAKIIERENDLRVLEFEGEQSCLEILYQYGHIPLPVYIKRPDEILDKERYQTVYAKYEGSVAAPTAGLHFDQALLDAISKKGVEMGFITLHVGAGTFQPLRCENITEHKMHSEYFEVTEKVCAQIKATKKQKGRVIAVGTTTVRALETLAQVGDFLPHQGNTSLFIYPGYNFHMVDAMITNFHFPKSSLLMLVAAMAGIEHTKRAYQEAIAQRYRFYSYGDAMFIR